MKKLALLIAFMVIGCSKTPTAVNTPAVTNITDYSTCLTTIPEIDISDTTIRFNIEPVQYGVAPLSFFSTVYWGDSLITDTLNIYKKVNTTWFNRDTMTVTTYLKWSDVRGEHQAVFTELLDIVKIAK